jgi:hypothetical protein
MVTLFSVLLDCNRAGNREYTCRFDPDSRPFHSIGFPARIRARFAGALRFAAR